MLCLELFEWAYIIFTKHCKKCVCFNLASKFISCSGKYFFSFLKICIPWSTLDGRPPSLWRCWLCRRVGNGFEEPGSAMRQIASPLALLDSGPPRPYSLFVSHRARSLLDTATKLNTRLQPHGRTTPPANGNVDLENYSIAPLHCCRDWGLFNI